ncbi:MAG TPA: DUF1080 domain-containing protein [Gemmataceae bacterium]|jgi:hypothetical protein|nr:DUF1080 domain-containing protein [Gemmataceae bacterium]
MRFYLSATLFLFLNGMSPGAEQSQPHTVTPKEVADGWILLFDGNTTFGWKVDGDAKVSDGVLRLGGTKATMAKTTTEFGDFSLGFDYRPEGPGVSTLILGKHTVSLKDRPIKPSEFLGYRLDKELEISDRPRGIEIRIPAGSELVLRNMVLRPSNLRPLFNGKDLTGWKEFPGKKSKFSITPEGWINIKDGPGDLQTEGQFDDFILQIECISNGKNLNSGVFFRCRANEYQNGYEAQIHNGFSALPVKEYTLEEFDPLTHKKIGQKKVKYTANDYGTGAIYRRQPARFQVAKDNEWFTMTVVAHANHFSVWVNGIGVTDWTDNRPPADNARNGYRKEKGHISLQGHDPTTDLSFRNIRIAEMKK